MEIFEVKKEFLLIKEKYVQLVAKTNINYLEEKKGALTVKVNAPNFWNNQKEAAETNKQLQTIINKLDLIVSVENYINDYEVLLELFEDEDIDLNDINLEFEKLKKIFTKFEIDCLLSGEYDDNDAIIEIHPGAGGTESQDWASMLYTMYNKYFKKMDYKVTIIDLQIAEVAGIKSVTIEVSGEKIYGKLKGENGIHRLVRISPFDSASKRHTSFASVNVTPIIEQDDQIIINPKDLKIDVYRSGGAGGQGVNTTDSAVRITHLPTKTVITCQNQRSQIQNKEQALKVLKSKLLEIKIREQEEKKAKLNNEQLSNGWGSQKRSYILHPYKLIKDHHVNFESTQAEKVLNGELDDFIYHNLLQ